MQQSTYLSFNVSGFITEAILGSTTSENMEELVKREAVGVRTFRNEILGEICREHVRTKEREVDSDERWNRAIKKVYVDQFYKSSDLSFRAYACIVTAAINVVLDFLKRPEFPFMTLLFLVTAFILMLKENKTDSEEQFLEKIAELREAEEGNHIARTTQMEKLERLYYLVQEVDLEEGENVLPFETFLFYRQKEEEKREKEDKEKNKEESKAV